MTSDPAQPLLRMDQVRAGYGPIEVLRGISLEVQTGEIVTIIGANGAGKTSTLMCISGILKAREGRIVFDGQEIQEIAAHARVRRGLVQVPEGRKIFPRLTVLENLQMGAFLRSDAASVAQDLNQAFELFPLLHERQSQPGGTLSGGEQQMLAIARALMSRPRLLLMDEPSMGIAPVLVAKIFEAIRTLNQHGLTILLVEQNAHQALRLATRGYVMETGRIVLADRAGVLLSDPRVREAYLGEA